MKMLKSVLLTTVIVGSVWGAVWAQNLLKPVEQSTDLTGQAAAQVNKLTELKKPLEAIKQQPSEKSISKTAQPLVKSKQLLPKKLLGLSRSSTFIKAESTANALMAELAQTPGLFNSLKEGEKLNFYLVYKQVSQTELLISSAIAKRNLKLAGLQTLVVPQGLYQKLAGVSDDVADIANAWQQLDLKRDLLAVVEVYQLDQLGEMISARSFVAYKR